jgi:predicted RNA-binding protein
MNNLIGFTGSFDDFFETFKKNLVPYGPLDLFYEDVISVSKSLNLGDRVLVIKYEDLKKDFEGQVAKISTFLGRSPPSSEQMVSLKKHCSFEEMQVNPSVNYSYWRELGIQKEGESPFMRKGIVGDWRSHFSLQQTDEFRSVMSSKAIQDIGYQ